MDIRVELWIVLKLIIAFAVGAFIGLDRERHGRDAGIRTYAAVCIGATLFTSVANHLVGDVAAVSRIVANIVTGVGFLGAGIIYRNNSAGTSHGLTTAATVWCTSATGIAIGLNMFVIAVVSAFGLYFLLSLHHFKWYIKWKEKIAGRDDEKKDD